MMAEESLKSFSWYHGIIGREEANTFLESKALGLFLVRKRKGVQSEYVLSVSEVQKVNHYIILDVNGMYFKIGEQRFADIPSIIEFYKKHTLDTTTLKEPVLRPGSELDPQFVVNHLSNPDLMKVRAKFNFHGRDPEDLPFKKSDMLTVIRKEEEEWWLARDNTGREGMIPATYVVVIASPMSPSRSSPTLANKPSKKNRHINDYAKPKSNPIDPHPQIPVDHVGPLFVLAVLNKEESFYDEKVLGFKKGDRIEVLKTSDNGSWEGRNLKTGKTGLFPFTHVTIESK